MTDAKSFLDLDWFDRDAANFVINSTAIPLAASMSQDLLGKLLTDLVNQSIGIQFHHLRTKKEWERCTELLKYVLEYAALAEHWSSNGQFVPRLSPAQIESMKALRGQLVDELRGRHNEKWRRKGAWEDSFYPRILGLYAVAFDDEPKSYLRYENESVAHPAISFIEAVIKHVSDRQAQTGYDQEIQIDGIESIQWPLNIRRTISGRISHYKKRRHFQFEDHPLWECYRDEYRMGLGDET
ncbi:hypothetical protein [Aliiruegeria sabulilitoris]|uniref:hypothetical protein n=1 Tax=Aliiruegeria sabulilitoris TaxID=1510458 RepID=UPI0008314422|nr:hypothetical protein [Aliiruegeria sabulilitoris]NDR55385.1 hypothetical protein [Pseudoruegeria sp. M32A2M]